jgi:hypothetical protein
MDKEANSLLILAEASERLSKEQAVRLSPSGRVRELTGRMGTKQDSFTNWDNEQRIKTYVNRKEQQREKPPTRCSSEARRRPGLLLPTTLNWREEFPDLEKYLCSRTRAVTYPLAKPANTRFLLCQSTRIGQWKAVPSKDLLSNVVFPAKSSRKSSQRSLRKTPESRLNKSMTKASSSEAMLRRSRLLAYRSTPRPTPKY